jgi:hypothetical protein
MDQSATPSLRSVIARSIGSHVNGMRVALPGRVVAYDPIRQSVDVLPLIQDGFIDEDGERQAERVPILNNVPVVFPGCGSYRITFPIEVGDQVLLVFCSSSIARWKLTGGEVDPGDDRRHDLNDAIAIPGVHSFSGAPTLAPLDALVLHGDQIKLGVYASNPAILGNLYRNAEDVLLTALGVFATTVGTAIGNAGAATTLNTAITAFKTLGASYLSTKVSVE